MKKNLFVLIPFLSILMACGTIQKGSSVVSYTDGLDIAIREASNYINNNVPVGIELAFISIKSDYPQLSEYIIDVLSGNVVNDRIFTVVDRTHLEEIRNEENYQLSGEVSDESARSIGRKLGAGAIVLGSITPLGNQWRLTVRSLDIESSKVLGIFNRNIPNDYLMLALTSSTSQTISPAVIQTSVPEVKTADAIVFNTHPLRITLKGVKKELVGFYNTSFQDTMFVYVDEDSLNKFFMNMKLDKNIQFLYIKNEGVNNMALATVNISFQRKLLDQIDKLATDEARTRSELIREATRMYIDRKLEWERICALGQSIGTTLDFTENDVAGIIKEARKTSKK
jgi:hypothetical protein